MRLTEDVQNVTLGGLRRFIEQAERSGASRDTPVEMTRKRNGGVATLTVEFDPGNNVAATPEPNAKISGLGGALSSEGATDD